MAGVAATYAAARRLWGVREGLVAAAVLAFAFLPVAYSRVAVTDVGALAGVALALMWSVRAAEDGRTRDYVLAGAAAGLAIAFKYTAGLVLLPLAIAAVARLRADGARPVAGLALGGAAAALVFALLNPYVFGSLGRLVERPARPGGRGRQRPEAGPAVGRLLLLPRQPHLGSRLGRDGGGARRRGAGAAARPGARPACWWRCRWRCSPTWRCSRATSGAGCCPPTRRWRCWPRWRWCAWPSCCAAALAGRRHGGARAGGDRAAAAGRRAHGAGAGPRGHAQPGPRVAGRDLPARAARVDRAGGARGATSAPTRRAGSPPWLSRCPQQPGWTERGWSYLAAGGRRVCDQYKPGLFVRPDGGVRASAYHAVLGPSVIDDYRLYGYCLVMTVNVVRDRALETGDPRGPRLLRAARARGRPGARVQPLQARAPTRSRSASTSPTTTTRAPTSAPGRRCASTGCATASRRTGRR